MLQPKNTVELGTKDGVSTIFLLSELSSDSHLATIDIEPNPRCLEHLASDPRLTIITSDDLDPRVLDALSSQLAPDQPDSQDPARIVDLLFIDTEHNAEQVTQELNTYSAMLRDGAIVVVDDIHLNPEMEAWWQALPYEKIDTGLTLHHSGFGLFRFKISPAQPLTPDQPKLAVMYYLHDDALYLKQSIDAFKDFGDVFVFISQIPWHGEPGDWERAAEIAGDSGATVMTGEWGSEGEQRQAAQRHIQSLGYTHALIPDGDEIIEASLLGELKKIAEHQLADRVYVEWDTYWKTPEYLVRPREKFTPLLLVDLNRAFHLELRNYGGGRSLFLPAGHGIVHHLSYCGPESRIERKIGSWSHRREVKNDWFEHVWRKWDENRSMQCLHPTHPEAYGFAERVPVPEILADALHACVEASDGEATGHSSPPTPESWPSISIIVPVHGQAAVLERCLSSLDKLQDLWHEVLVVDNASTDRAKHIVRAYPWAKLLENETNLGFAAACNQGYENSTGEIVLFLNSDTVMPRAGLIRLIESLAESQSIAAAGPLSNNCGHFQQTAISYSDRNQLDLFADDFAHRPQQDIDTDMLSGFCLAVRRNVLAEVGGFDERFGVGLFEDNDLCYRIRRVGYRMVVSARSFVHHEGSASLSHMKDTGKLFEANRIKFERKWHEDIEAGFASALSGLTADAITFTAGRKPEKLKVELAHKAKQAQISICMIVKNEERVLADCLASVVDVFPEIVVVDTGSTDQTKHIACEYEVNLIESTWHDSFSIARNESIAAATGRWIFWIDADDTVPLTSAEHLINEISNAPSNVHAFVVPVQFVEDGPGAGTRVDHVKAFRNLPGIKFEGRIHEQILGSLHQHGGLIARSNAVVLHSGYDTSEQGQRKKSEREDKLLWLDHSERPSHPFPCFNLGMTFHFRGDHKAAAKWLRKSIELCDERETILRKAYCLLGVSLRQLGKETEALKTFENGLAAAPDDIELRFQLASQLSSSGRHKEAIERYRECLSLKPDGYYSSFDTGIRSFKTLHNVAIEHMALGEHQEAVAALKDAIALAPHFVPSAESLFAIAMEDSDLETASFAMEAVRAAEGMSERWATMGAFYAERTQGSDGPTTFLSRALQSSPSAIPVRLSLARKLISDGNEDEAMDHWPILANAGVAEAAYFMGVALNRQGDFESALPWMRRAAELNPEHEETRKQIEALERMLKDDL